MYQSGIYWKFVGFGQLVAGLLLMTQKYAKLGAILFLPIILNIFVITISYDFRGTPFITGSMLLANILLIIWDWDTLKVLFNKQPVFPKKDRIENNSIWIILGTLFFILTIFAKLVISSSSLLIIALCFLIIGLLGLIIGIRRNKKLRFRTN